MVMQSNAIVCGRDLSQAYRDERCYRTRSCAELLPGKLISSCPMHSNAVVCWRGSLKRIACRQALERLHVPGDLRQRDCCMPVHRCITPAAQPALAQERSSISRDDGSSCRTDVRPVGWEVAADGASRPRDRGYFESWDQLDSNLDL